MARHGWLQRSKERNRRMHRPMETHRDSQNPPRTTQNKWANHKTNQRRTKEKQERTGNSCHQYQTPGKPPTNPLRYDGHIITFRSTWSNPPKMVRGWSPHNHRVDKEHYNLQVLKEEVQLTSSSNNVSGIYLPNGEKGWTYHHPDKSGCMVQHYTTQANFSSVHPGKRTRSKTEDNVTTFRGSASSIQEHHYS